MENRYNNNRSKFTSFDRTSTAFVSANNSFAVQQQDIAQDLAQKLNLLQEDLEDSSIRPERISSSIDGIPHLRWCAYCGRECSTLVVHKPSDKTFWSAVGIFFMGGVFGCFLLPYATHHCQEPSIVCQRCERTLK